MFSGSELIWVGHLSGSKETKQKKLWPGFCFIQSYNIPLVHKNLAQGYYNAEKMINKQCPIIPIEQHGIYANGVDVELLEDMHDMRSPKYLLDYAM